MNEIFQLEIFIHYIVECAEYKITQGQWQLKPLTRGDSELHTTSDEMMVREIHSFMYSS